MVSVFWARANIIEANTPYCCRRNLVGRIRNTNAVYSWGYSRVGWAHLLQAQHAANIDRLA